MGFRKLLLLLFTILVMSGVAGFGVYLGMTQFSPLAQQLNAPAATTSDPQEPSPVVTSSDPQATIAVVPTSVSSLNDDVTPIDSNAQTESSSAVESLQSLLNSEVGIVILVVIGALIVIILGFVLYFTVLQPRRKRSLFIKAQADLLQDNQAGFEAAEQKLIKALEAGMSTKDVAEARFMLAYARTQLRKYPEAALDIANFRTTGHISKEGLYLELRLHLQLEEYAKGEELYKEYKDELLGFRDSRYLFSAVFYERAKELWNAREIEAAIHCFDTLRELGEKDFIQYIPEKTDDKFVVFGILSLYAKNIEEAHDFFMQALSRQGSDTAARLGLILCTALSDPDATIDAEIEALVAELQSRANSLDVNDRLILRNALLWLLMLEIKSWKNLPEKQGLPAENLERAKHHLNKIKKIDADFSDTYLIEGLLTYLFSKTPKERHHAVDILKSSTKKKPAVNYADVKVLIDKELEMREAYKDPAAEIIKIVIDYKNNPKVPKELREELHKVLEPYSVYKQAPGFEGVEESTAKPTIEDVRNRGNLTSERISGLLDNTTIAPELRDEIEENVKDLKEIITSLSEQSRNLDDAEYKVIRQVSQTLPKEEAPITMPVSKKRGKKS